MTDHLLHVTLMYKMGHSMFKVKGAIQAKTIVAIEQVPEEMPEYADGMMSRLRLLAGEILMVADPYDNLVIEWNSLLELA